MAIHDSFPESIRANTVAKREALVKLLKQFIAENSNFDYNQIRPEHMRLIGSGVTHPAYHPPYVPYSTILKGLSIDPQTGVPNIPGTSQPLTHRNQLPPGAKPEATIEVRFAKEMVKVPWLISGEVDDSVLWRFLPKELRGEETDARTKNFFSEVKSIKDNLRHYWVKETVLPLVLFWMTRDSSEWATQPDPNVIDTKLRNRWWLERIKEDQSVIIWYMAKFRNIVNFRFLFCELAAANFQEQRIKREMKAWLVGKLVLLCDMIYRGLVDHDPLDKEYGGTFFEFSAIVTASLKHHQADDALKTLMPRVSDWPVRPDCNQVRTTEDRNPFDRENQLSALDLLA